MAFVAEQAQYVFTETSVSLCWLEHVRICVMQIEGYVAVSNNTLPVSIVLNVLVGSANT